ncbi:transposase [Thiomicrorhabdus sp. Kp2]|uniref:REP-associated tyrosine transposase n=1 Tax=Thiomicrorhabdus sp. Kp2 TaxID=1123518 RepID=UPI00041BEDB1|nr:transposase [Thiomicrorhabdus sp. Kp2]
MTRPLRIEFAGALYHVTSRGNAQEDIYRDDKDRTMFLEILKEVCERFNWVIHAYCLMSNHYHLLVETPDGNLSKGMRHLNGVYTQRFNRTHNRVGHVFQGRYKAILVQKDSYLLELARYIVLNPVRANKVLTAQDWPWSSYRSTAGFTSVENWLTVDWILSSFSDQKINAAKVYREFVSEGMNQPKIWDELKNQIYLGDESFIKNMQSKISSKTSLEESPSAQTRKVAKPITYFESQYIDRDVAICKAYETGAFSMKAIGNHFGLHYSRVSRIVKAKGKT